jgi:predicted nucleic acid-binding protein
MAGREEAVIDASVAVKWFSEEEGTDRAIEIRDSHIDNKRTLVAPDLLVYEIANALRFKTGFTEEHVARAIDDLLDLQIDLIEPGRELIRLGSEIAYRYRITFYDSSYLALGELMGIDVYTSDKQLYERARESNLLKLV